MEKVKIQRVFISNKSRDGKEFKTKAGKPFQKVAIKTEQYPEVWMSKLVFNDSDPALMLKEGDQPTLKIWQSEDGGFYNFEFPKVEDEVRQEIDDLWSFVNNLASDVKELKEGRGADLGKTMREMKKDEVNIEDIPF